MIQILANILYQVLSKEPENKIKTISLLKRAFPEKWNLRKTVTFMYIKIAENFIVIFSTVSEVFACNLL